LTRLLKLSVSLFSVLYVVRITCPKCGQSGVLTFKNIGGKECAYVVHWLNGRLKRCCVGKADEVLRAGELMEPPPNAPAWNVLDPSGQASGQQPPTQDDVEGYFSKLKVWSSKPEYTDEELLKAVVKEAQNDYFCGTGRIFINEFTKWYGCSRERLLGVLERSQLKWRLDPNGVVVLINL
jgi:hypothetical protein